MTVTLKPKTEIIVPKSIRRKAGIKPGDRVEFSVSGRVINIIPKLSPDELQDEREIRDPKVRAAIRKSHREFLAGKTRSAEELLAELKRIKPENPKPSRREMNGVFDVRTTLRFDRLLKKSMRQRGW